MNNEGMNNDELLEDLWKRVFDSLEDMILIVDEEHKIIKANRSLEDFLELSQGKIEGRTCSGLFDIEQKEEDQKCPLICKNSYDEKEFYYPKKDKHLLVQSFPVSEKDSEYTIHQIRDITEKNDIEGDLKEYSEELERYKRETQEMIQSEKMASLGRLVSGVAHEINNPLGYMRASIGFIKDDIRELKEICDEDEIAELLEGMDSHMEMYVEGINRITNITETLRKFVSADIGTEVKTDLNENIRSTLTLLANEFRKDIKVKQNLGDIPDVKCNPGELNQVFINVIYNAIESMEKGTVEIKTWAEDQKVFVKIKDEGGGIYDDVKNKIFDPFFTTKDKSTGLGLSVSYRIVKKHGGNIDIESIEGEGTEVTISIPLEANDVGEE
ncbi:MAG: two-component system sensor histidine kinase NtrB [Candidatus Saliniplasma sp.]